MANRGGAEQFVRSKQYDYAANANLVLTADRSGKMSSEPSGAPETLWGKLRGKMGDKAFSKTNAPEDLVKRKAKGAGKK